VSMASLESAVTSTEKPSGLTRLRRLRPGQLNVRPVGSRWTRTMTTTDESRRGSASAPEPSVRAVPSRVRRAASLRDQESRCTMPRRSLAALSLVVVPRPDLLPGPSTKRVSANGSTPYVPPNRRAQVWLARHGPRRRVLRNGGPSIRGVGCFPALPVRAVVHHGTHALF